MQQHSYIHTTNLELDFNLLELLKHYYSFIVKSYRVFFLFFFAIEINKTDESIYYYY